jgi:GT2 family glycosyltransferase
MPGPDESCRDGVARSCSLPPRGEGASCRAAANTPHPQPPPQGEREQGKTRPALSIVIPSHRRADLLRLCLASVTAHAPPGTEVIVVDDASPGGQATATAADFPGVRFLRLPRQSGFCVAANHGIDAARAPVVELLNDDTVVTPGWADAPLARFTDPHVGAVAPLVLLGPPAHNPPRIDSAGDSYDPGGFARKRGHGRPLTDEHRRPGWVFGASGSSAFYRRDAVRRLGGFPESFGAYFEDVDLSWRLQTAGFGVWYEPASVVWHRGGASHGRRCWRLLARQSCNEERVFWRNVPPRWLARHALVLAGKTMLRALDGTLVPFLAGRAQAWSELPRHLAHRRMFGRAGGVSPLIRRAVGDMALSSGG